MRFSAFAIVRRIGKTFDIVAKLRQEDVAHEIERLYSIDACEVEEIKHRLVKAFPFK